MSGAEWLSHGVENLLARIAADPEGPHFDVAIVGSGYGGSIAAARLAGALQADGTKLRVCVLERGREYVSGTFPEKFGELPGHVRIDRYDDPQPRGQPDGLFDFRLGPDVSALVGNGLGGGSLINASVMEPPRDRIFQDPKWPEAIRK